MGYRMLAVASLFFSTGALLSMTKPLRDENIILPEDKI